MLKSGYRVQVDDSPYAAGNTGYLFNILDFPGAAWDVIICDFDPFKPGWLYFPFSGEYHGWKAVLKAKRWEKHYDYEGKAWRDYHSSYTLCPVQVKDIKVLGDGFSSEIPQWAPSRSATRRGKKHRMKMPKREVECE